MNLSARSTGRALARRAALAAFPLFLLAAASAFAQSPTPAATPAALPTALPTTAPAADPVLIGNSTAQVRKSDYELELLRLPPEARAGFPNSKRRIQDLLSGMIVTKTLAAQAFASKLDQDPEVVARFKSETERFYAGARQAMVERASGAEFDAKTPQMEARARELYLANLKRFEVPEKVTASHILFALEKHPKDEGLKLAQETRAQIVAGANFNAVASKSSDDTSARQNAGKIDYFAREEMDPAFADAAFKLAKVGDMSEPVLSQFGWHLIRLDGRKAAGPVPYEDVRARLLIEMRKQYVDERRNALLAGIDNDPTTIIDEPAIDALYVPPAPAPAVPAAATPAPDAPKRITSGGKPTPEQKEQIRARRFEEMTPK